jgi:transposase
MDDTLRTSAPRSGDPSNRVRRFWIVASRLRSSPSRNSSRYPGLVASDRLGAYEGSPLPQRQLCWAHLKRDLAAWQSYGRAARRIGSWAAAEAERLFERWHRFRAGEVDRAQLRRHLQPLRARMRRLLARGTNCGVRRVEKRTKQLLTMRPALWSFTM